jgi:hypothetical protein
MPTHRRWGEFIAFKIGTVICFMVWVSLLGCTNRWSRQNEKGLWVTPEASFRYGEVHGFVQTPLGGSSGTTSDHRPTFKEIGIKGAAMGDVSLTAGLRNNAIYGGARIVELSGSDVLDSPLISHGTTFPAGSLVRGDVQLNWYQVGYQHCFLYGDEQGKTFGFYPGIGVALLDFKYGLKGPSGLSANRSYIKVAPQIGLGWEWMLTRRFAVSGGVYGTLPISDMPFIFSPKVVGSYRLWDKEGLRALLFLGIGYDRVEYKDKQDVPNHIKADIGPEIITGLQVSF